MADTPEQQDNLLSAHTPDTGYRSTVNFHDSHGNAAHTRAEPPTPEPPPSSLDEYMGRLAKAVPAPFSAEITCADGRVLRGVSPAPAGSLQDFDPRQFQSAVEALGRTLFPGQPEALRHYEETGATTLSLGQLESPMEQICKKGRFLGS